MAVLFPLFWYTGFNQPCQLTPPATLTHVSFRTTRSPLCRYQLNTFGDRFFDSRALGLELASFYLAEARQSRDRAETEPRQSRDAAETQPRRAEIGFELSLRFARGARRRTRRLTNELMN